MFGEAVFIFLLLVWQVFKVPKLKKVAAYISIVNVINKCISSKQSGGFLLLI